MKLGYTDLYSVSVRYTVAPPWCLGGRSVRRGWPLQRPPRPALVLFAFAWPRPQERPSVGLNGNTATHLLGWEAADTLRDC